MIPPPRERRDWTLLVFIIPIGIIFMLIAGQVAIRLVPEWSLNAGMQSNLDPNELPMQQNGLVQPVLPAILTPLGWLDTFLTPGAGAGGNSFPPFIIFEPSKTPVVTNPPPTVVTTQPSPTQPSPTAPTATAPTVVTPPATGTKPPDGGEETPPPPTTTPPTPIPVTSTPAGTQVSAPPNIVGDPDLSFYNLQDGQYIVVNLGTTPIIVEGTPDTDYDLVYYEMANPINIAMDQVIIGISQDINNDGVFDGIYYEVFNWGDGNPDLNSNVGSIAGAETDNQVIIANNPSSVLYGTPPYQTGVLIDVDNASSNPPIGIYQFLVVIAPETSADDGADINSVQVVEVTNTSASPIIAPLNNAPSVAKEEPSVQTSEAPGDTSPPVDEQPNPPENDPSPPDIPSDPPAEEPPSTP
ncbi:hypothetical protein ANAEL_03400 [Anaerolineales bacterium]|nr:hypothetical protein ANAEL_03400 [Anaerolineales bacterium]